MPHNDVCDCCSIPKPRHFKTSRRCICKDCIDQLNESDISPADIFFCHRSYFEEQVRERINGEAEMLKGLRSAPPTLYQPTYEQLLAHAYEQAKQEEGFWQSLYRKLGFGKSRRAGRAAQIAADRQAQIARENASRLLAHRERESRIDSAFKALTRQAHADAVEERALADMLAYFADQSTSGRRSTEALVLRAYSLKLIDYERRGVRLPDQEWKAISGQVWKQDKGHCMACPSGSASVEVHHIVWIKNGGTNREENLITLCLPCHDREHPWLANQRKGK